MSKYADPIVTDELIDRLVNEGRVVGKIPWCTSSIAEMAAAKRLETLGITEQETMTETLQRRAAKRYPRQFGPR